MDLGKSKIFLLFCVSFIFGVFAGKFVSYTAMAFSAMVFVMLATLGWRKKAWMIAGFLGLTVLLGAWRWQQSFAVTYAENFVGNYYEQKVEWEGVVVRDPDVRSNKVNLTLGELTPSQSPPSFPASPAGRQEGEKIQGNILLNVGRYPEYQYGDRLRFMGKLEEPFVTEEFSYKDYLSRYDTYAVMRFPKVERTGEEQGSKITAALYRAKHRLQDVIVGVLPEPASALLLGIILGLKRSLPESLSTALVMAGVSHIVVISGYNISILTKNVLRSRGLLGRRAALILSASVILAFVVMTGAEASVVRAAIMGFALIAATGTGRLYAVQNAVIFAGAAMIAQNPKILQFDIGFQLSFMATLGIIYFSPILEMGLRKIKIPEAGFLSLRGNLSSTTAALVFTLPLLLYHFERLSVYAIPANVLILWSVPYVMALGMAVAFVGLVFLSAAKLIAATAWVLLQYQIWLVTWVAGLPGAAMALAVDFRFLVAYYALLVLGLWYYRYRNKFWYYLEYAEVKL